MSKKLLAGINLLIALAGAMSGIALTVLSAIGSLRIQDALTATLGVLSVLLLMIVSDKMLVSIRLQRSVDQVYDAVHTPLTLKPWAQLTAFDEFVTDCDSVLIVGLTKAGPLTEGSDRLYKLVKSGCRVRLAVLDAQTVSLYEYVARSTTHTTVRLMGDFSIFLETIRAVRQNLTGRENARLEVHTYPFSPTAGIVLAYRGRSVSAQVYFYPYKTDPAQRPAIELREGEGSEWLAFFREQYERLWEDISKLTVDPSLV
jgi:hypothetical protein